MANIILALQITIVGMSLIFCVILLLWFILALLVFILGKANQNKKETNPSLELSDSSDDELIRQEAVAAAVSAALVQKSLLMPGHFPLPPTAIVSAWQAVLRGDMLSKRGRIR